MAQKSLVIQTAFLGDVLLAIPLILHLKKKGPVTLVCRQGFADFFLKTGLCERVFEVKKGDSNSYRKIQSELGGFDLVVSPHVSFRSARLAGSVPAPIKLGFSRWWNRLFFTHRLKRNLDLPDALRQLSLLMLVDSELKTKFQSLQGDQKYIDSKFPEWAKMRLDYGVAGAAAKRAFMAPGSVWATKRWMPEGYIAVGQELSRKGFEVVLVGSPEERSECGRIAEQIPGAKNIAGEPSLFELGKYLQTGQLMISNDNGAMHLASTAGVPTVGIFGPTVLSFGYRPWNPNAAVVETQGLNCRPCGKHGHQVCPIGTHECMKRVSPQQVLKAIEGLNSRP